MTDIEKKALALVNAAVSAKPMRILPIYVDKAVLCEALLRALEQHEAFKREVSDAVEAVFAGYHDAPILWAVVRRKLERFIIPKPDPLVEALWDAGFAHNKDTADQLRAALAARGLEIREKQP